MNKMKLKIVLNRGIYLMSALAILCSLNSCQPDAVGVGNGLTDTNVDASFTVKPVEGAVNKFILSAQKTNVIASKWDIGEGTYSGKMIETVFFPDAGTYTVAHTAIGKGGFMNSSSQDILVASSDPVAGNIIQGGKFENAADHGKWTVLNLSPSGAAKWTFNTGSATIKSSGSWNQEAIYQLIEVVKDKEYTVDMLVSSLNGSNETWFEVYVGKTAPTSGVEYKDNKVMGLSTWDGCATAAFSGRLSVVGCVKNDRTKNVSNVVKFAESGTVYFVIRCGGNTFTQSGITVKNVELRGK